MNLLELHAGSRSVGNVADELGLNVFSVDWQKFNKIDLSIDIEFLKIEDIPFIPDAIWTSPDCTTYSIAAISHHRDGIIPKSDYAKKCDRVNENQIKLIRHYLSINNNLVYFIENPRGMMRKTKFINELLNDTLGFKHTVWYCKYGDNRAKPTDIFTNSRSWIPRNKCFNGNKKCHHESAPRGSKTGTQGRKNSYDRSKIPNDLCLEILKSIII